MATVVPFIAIVISFAIAAGREHGTMRAVHHKKKLQVVHPASGRRVRVYVAGARYESC